MGEIVTFVEDGLGEQGRELLVGVVGQALPEGLDADQSIIGACEVGGMEAGSHVVLEKKLVKEEFPEEQ